MTSLTIATWLLAALAAAASVWLVRRVLRIHGRDSFEDPERVARVLEAAPSDRAERVTMTGRPERS